MEDYTANTQMGSSTNNNFLRLRTSLEDLYALWEERIVKRRPFQYIVGCEHWRDMVLAVEEGVLIPRPETEVLVDMVEEVVRERKDLREGLWVDLGTGSGAIGLGISGVLGESGLVIAVDLSPVAIAVAKYNIERYNLQDRVEVRQGSWFEPLQDVKGKIAGLVSNPPYIPSEHIPGLQPEVGKHEPISALDGGKNGMDYLLHLCMESASALTPGGFVAFETNGKDQSKIIAEFLHTMPKNGFCDVKIRSDFAGIPRFVTGFLR
ncbi:hypothetical protein AMTR_s00155p00066160 [Amborella trichopoda]|uniref:Methyltransferase small domain-containing protein n=2 Tax=Amborella trichopoda TaxID=13333 RepID=W1PCQ4_AMBTC|nr:hypothetical protein AMTR_s00155p00066160 [Amborella trichopoda]